MKASVILVINPRMDVANNLQVPAEIESKINDAGSPDIYGTGPGKPISQKNQIPFVT